MLVIATLVAYHNSFSVPFIYDDMPAIFGNVSIQRLWPIWPALSPPTDLTTSGRPMVNLSLAITMRSAGLMFGGITRSIWRSTPALR